MAGREDIRMSLRYGLSISCEIGLRKPGGIALAGCAGGFAIVTYFFKGKGTSSIQASLLKVRALSQREFVEIVEILKNNPGKSVRIERAATCPIQGLTEHHQFI
jgi:hypothetical protein